MTSRREPGPGQAALEAMPEVPQEPLDLDSRCAFGRILTPKFFNLTPDMVPATLSPEVYEMVSPDRLGEMIFVGGRQSVGGVLWNSEEYSAMARSVEAIGKASVSKTLQARQLDPDVTRRQQKADRAAQHTLFGNGDNRKYYENMQGLLTGYEEERRWLVRLNHESYTPGWAHMTAGEMLVLATNVWSISFEKHLLRAVSEHEGWDKAQHTTAIAALRYNLFYDKQKSKKDYWQSLMEIELRHNTAKSTLLRSRLRQIERRL